MRSLEIKKPPFLQSRNGGVEEGLRLRRMGIIIKSIPAVQGFMSSSFAYLTQWSVPSAPAWNRRKNILPEEGNGWSEA
jgi:hypothetical protein